MSEEQIPSDIKSFIDTNELVFFFKKNKEHFGATEENRLMFAQIKHPDKDLGKGWKNEATFSAVNLNKVLRGEPAQHIFSKNDIKEIDVIDVEKIVSSLKGKAKVVPMNILPSSLVPIKEKD